MLVHPWDSAEDEEWRAWLAARDFGQLGGKAVIVNRALEEGRLGAEDVRRRRRNVVVQVSAEIIQLLVVAVLRDEGRLRQHDMVFRIDRDDPAVEPFIEHGTGPYVSCDG